MFESGEIHETPIPASDWKRSIGTALVPRVPWWIKMSTTALRAHYDATAAASPAVARSHYSSEPIVSGVDNRTHTHLWTQSLMAIDGHSFKSGTGFCSHNQNDGSPRLRRGLLALAPCAPSRISQSVRRSKSPATSCAVEAGRAPRQAFRSTQHRPCLSSERSRPGGSAARGRRRPSAPAGRPRRRRGR